MDSEEVIFVQEKRKYRRKKGCSVMPPPPPPPKQKAKKAISPKMEAAAKTTRKYTKKALILKKANNLEIHPENVTYLISGANEHHGETSRLEEGEWFGAAASSELPQGGRSNSHLGRPVHLRGRGTALFSTPCQGAAGLQPLLRPPADDAPPPSPPPTTTTTTSQILPSSLQISNNVCC